MQAFLQLVLGAVAVVGAIYAHRSAARTDRPALWITLAFDVVIAALVALAVLDSSRFRAGMQEDAWAEWATAIAFGTAAVLFARARPRTVASIALAAFCVFVAGEELSWGQRLFAFEPPEIFLEENFQQELNVHNFLKGKELAGFSLDSRFLVALVAVCYGLIAPALLWAHRSARINLRWLEPMLRAAAPPGALVPWFAAVAWVELEYPVKLAGEAAELVLGLLFIASARAPWNTGARRTFALLAAPIAIGAIMPSIVSRVVYGPDDQLVRRAEQEVAALGLDLHASARDKLRRKKRVHKRVFTAVRGNYFRFERDSRFLGDELSPAQPGETAPRRDRFGYFLDPWNNPYWVHYSRKSRRLIVYSFGANRRRDSTLRGEQPLNDDDIGTILELAPRGG